MNLRENTLRGKTTGGDEQAIYYEDEDIRYGSQQGWRRLQIPLISLSNGWIW